VVGIVLGAAVLAGAAVGGFYAYRLTHRPGPASEAAGLLPASTAALVSVEGVDRLELDLSRFTGIDRRRLTGAMLAYRKQGEVWLAQQLGVAPTFGAEIVRAADGLVLAAVPVKPSRYAMVVLVTLRTEAAADLLSRAKASETERAGNTPIYRGEGFGAVFGSTLAVCARIEPLRTMAKAASEGSRPLEGVADFAAARSEYGGRGRAWFYATDRVLRTADAFPPVGPFPMPRVANVLRFAPTVRYAAGALELADPRLDVRGWFRLPESRGDYDRVRLEPRKLEMMRLMPAEAEFAAAWSLGSPRRTYERVVEVLDGRIEERTGRSLRNWIDRLERRGDYVFLNADVMPSLSGEVGYFVLDGAERVDALLVGLLDREVGKEELPALLCKMFGDPPRIAGPDGASRELAYGLVGQAFVVSTGQPGLQVVATARKSEKGLATDGEFNKAMARLPSELSLVLCCRESRTEQERRFAPKPALAVAGLAMEEDGVSIAASVPDLVEFLVASAPPLPTIGPSETERPVAPRPTTPPTAAVEPRKENILRLAALCKRYVEDKGAGTRYPSSFSDLIARGVINTENFGVLTRPGDKIPVDQGTFSSSYRMAFDVVKQHTFTTDTAGDLPMVWEILAGPDGKRLVVAFDGSVRLTATSEEELIAQVRSAVGPATAPEKPEPTPEPEPKPADPQEPDPEKKEPPEKKPKDGEDHGLPPDILDAL
jgi:hypothetical protein